MTSIIQMDISFCETSLTENEGKDQVIHHALSKNSYRSPEQQQNNLNSA